MPEQPKKDVKASFASFTKAAKDAVASAAGSGQQAVKNTSRSAAPARSTASAAGTAAPAAASSGPRRVQLTLSRLDPWSVMKMTFLCAVGLGIATIVATFLLWVMVDAMGLWTKLNQLGAEMNGNKPLPLLEYLELGKVLAYAIVISVMNTVLFTALATLGAFLYNIVASLIGGLRLTFTDE